VRRVVDVRLFYLVLCRVVDQTLQDSYFFVVTCQDAVSEEVSLFSQVSLRNESRGELVYILYKVAVKLYREVLGSLNHIIYPLHILANVFVIVVMVFFFEESSDF
jgi:hypothetical protein